MDIFEQYRPLLFAIAYRMLGSAMEAEDVIQEAYLRYQSVASETIHTPKSYLTKMITNLCLDQLKSARAQREVYLGPWLPEPIVTNEDEPDTLSMAFLVLLETLTPAERAVFLLREVFDYSYHEIGEMLGKDPAACRQLLHRAKNHITAHRPRFSASPTQHQTILATFMQTLINGDFESMVQLLTEDALATSDGGGKVTAATRPIVGRERVAKFLFGLHRSYTPTMQTEVTTLNACPGLIIRDQGVIRVAMIFELHHSQIQAIRIIVNPEKLVYLSRKLG